MQLHSITLSLLTIVHHLILVFTWEKLLHVHAHAHAALRTYTCTGVADVRVE